MSDVYTRQKEYKEGVLARIMNHPIEDNPYPMRQGKFDKSFLWEKGWLTEDDIRKEIIK